MKNKIIKKLGFFIMALLLLSSLVTATLGSLKDEGQAFAIYDIYLDEDSSSLDEGEDVKVSVKVQNLGTSDGYQYIEAGFYELNSIKKWGVLPLALSLNVDNCIEKERYVETKKVFLKAGELSIIDLVVRVPDIEPTDDDYGLVASTFTNCGGESTTSSRYLEVGIDEAWFENPFDEDSKPKDYCFNAKQDGTETDHNCGGLCAKEFKLKCGHDLGCSKSADCQTGLFCKDSTCTVLDELVVDSFKQNPIGTTLMGVGIVGGIALLVIFGWRYV